MQVHIKVVGKWIKGWIFKRPMLSVKFADSQIKVDENYVDIPVKMAQWHGTKVGDSLLLALEQRNDGLWYPKRTF